MNSINNNNEATSFLNKNPDSLMIVDESTTIKNRSAKRTKNIIGLGKYSKYRRIMTGSPVTKNPLDLYTQCEFLDPYLLDFASYYSFRNRYAEMKTMHLRGRSIQVVSEFKNLGELSDTVKTFSERILKEDCLDLPPKIFMKRFPIIFLFFSGSEIFRNFSKNSFSAFT